MNGNIAAVALCITAFAMSATAQTVNNIPKYTSTGTFQGSAIWEVNGNVGIGTTTPNGSLDVYGPYAEPSLDANSAASANFRTWGNVQVAISTSSSSPYTTSFQAKHSTANGHTYSIALNPLGGNVGIGTGNLTSPLTVDGDIESTATDDTGGAILLRNPSKVASGTSAFWKIYNMTGAYGNSLQFWAYDNLGCVTGGLCASRFTLMDNGNVGIGTAGPNGKLEVRNDTNALNNDLIIRNNYTTAGSAGSRIGFGTYRDSDVNHLGAAIDAINTTGTIWGNAAQGADLVFSTNPDATTGLTERMRILSTGNVGVGTTSPGYKLDVEDGSVNSSGGYCIAGNCISAWPTSGPTTWNSAQTFNGGASFPGSGTWNSSGYVGIGTPNPATPLDVVANPTSTVPQVRISPIGSTGSSTSIPSYLDFYSSFDSYPADQGPRRTATVKARFSGGAWGNEALAFEVGTGGTNDVANEPTERMRITGAGNVGIGTTNPGAVPPSGYTTGTPILEVKGDVVLTRNSGGSITFQDGTTQSSAYTGVVCGGDYAESVDVTGSRANYEPGDVLVIDPNAHGRFLKGNQAYSTLVAGIFSTKPGTIGRRQTTTKSADEVPMAVVGIVPTKVSAENGAINDGDLLVASSTLGHAMKGTDRSKMLGAVIGKALGSLESGTGVIEVLVTLQ